MDSCPECGYNELLKMQVSFDGGKTWVTKWMCMRQEPFVCTFEHVVPDLSLNS